MYKNALVFGMTPEQFWLGNPQDFYLFGENYERRIKFDAESANQVAWLNSYYTLLAIKQVASEILSKNQKQIFPQSPIDFSKEQSCDMVEKFEVLANKFNKSFEMRNKNGAE